jgi:tRNA U54 and U55 pseudouridine synthase Pus10
MGKTFSDIISNLSNKECSDYLFDYLKLKRHSNKQEEFKSSETFVCEQVMNSIKLAKQAIETRKALSVTELSWEEVQNMDKPIIPSEIELKQAKLIN